MNVLEACDLLGVRGTATPEEVKLAHRRKSREVHPDRGGSHELMSQVNLAREILTGKIPSSVDDKPHAARPPAEPRSKVIEVPVSYEEWQSGLARHFLDADLNSILGKIVNSRFELNIPAFQDLDQPIRVENGESFVDFMISIDTGSFARRGYDLIGEKTISLYDYLYNQSFFFVHPLMKKRIKIQIPQSRSFISNGKNTILIKGRGLCSEEEQGNLLMSLTVEMPDFDNLSEKAKTLLKPGLAEISMQE